jgi:peroxiredoxin
MKTKDITIATFALLLVAGLAYVWFTPSGLKQAPDIRVTTLEGEALTLSQMKGRPLLVTFWATTCPGCIKEMPHLVELYKELSPRGLEIIAIAMEYDPEDQVRTMAAQKQLPYPVALDSDGSAAKAFGYVSLTPSNFLIDPQGRIVQYKLGEMDMNALHNRIVAMLSGEKA